MSDMFGLMVQTSISECTVCSNVSLIVTCILNIEWFEFLSCSNLVNKAYTDKSC